MEDDISRIKELREALLTVRFRFDPQVQVIRDQALDSIVVQILFIASGDEGLRLHQIQDAFIAFSGGHALQPGDVGKSIDRLLKLERVVICRKDDIEYFQLDSKAKEETVENTETSKRELDLVIKALFKEFVSNYQDYSDPFLEILANIFYKLGEESIRVIKRDFSDDSFLEKIKISSCVDEVKGKYTNINFSILEKAIYNFFNTIDPRYDSVKWYIAQNCYIAKSLGLDSSGISLSRQLFKGYEFYLDTNIIIEALEPKHEYHHSFLTFAKVCRSLDINLRVCQITLNELESWIAYQEQLLNDTIDQIPQNTSKNIGSPFYQAYIEKKKTNSKIVVSDIFNKFRDPMASLNELIDADMVDDYWFDQNIGDEKCSELITLLRKNTADKTRPKTFESATHDSQLLMWVDERRKEDSNALLLTTDASLIGKFDLSWMIESPAILLGSLLQWISPLVSDGSSEDFSSVFADMIRKRLLPQERIFQLHDFLIFHDMEMQCKNLPSKDVEGAILHIRKTSVEFDLNRLDDKIKLFHIVARYFASPDREYKHEIERLEQVISKMKDDFQSTTDAKEQEVQSKDSEIQDLKREFKEFRDESINKQLEKEGRFRIKITGTIYIILISLIILGGNKYGAGETLWQNTLSSWPFILAATAICIILSWFILGKKRLEALGWTFKKLLKYDE